MSINITVYVTSDLRHAPFLYEGINQLKSTGYINSLVLKPHKYQNRDRLVIKDNTLVRINRPYPYSIAVDIIDDNNKIKVGFDFQDWDYMFSHYSLKNCNIIFKRAYNQSMVDKIEKDYNSVKILPFGFTFNTEFNDTTFIRISKISKLINRIYYSFFAPKYLVRYINQYFQHFFKLKNNSINKKNVVEYKLPNYEYIFFQVEYHNYENHKEAKRLNNYRAKIIRELKKEFGRQFIGGMWSNGKIEEIYLDCQSDYLDKESYSLIIQNASLVISTSGFGNSFPWKLAEYLKHGKCIISERLDHKLPVPLIDNYHLMFFNDIQECIQICRDLLISKQKSTELSKNAKKYYLRNVEPKSVIYKCISNSLINN